MPNNRDIIFLPIAESFVSINGEGLHAGQFSTFIRFAGCNLHCSYCDTKWACRPDCPSQSMSCEELVSLIAKAKTPCVTLTGGEPLLQPHLATLIGEIVEKTSCFVEIETNGSCNLSEIALLRSDLEEKGKAKRIGFTMDWKLPSSGMQSYMSKGNLAFLGEQDCLKFVVGSTEDLTAAQKLIENQIFKQSFPVLFSPVFHEIEPAQIVEFLAANKLHNARMQLQMHKIIWPNVERGV